MGIALFRRGNAKEGLVMGENYRYLDCYGTDIYVISVPFHVEMPSKGQFRK